jgi:ATP adenylyltransferase
LTVPLERFSAAWRENYITETTERERVGGEVACVFCSLATDEPTESSGVIAHSASSFVCLNAYPYGSGHLLVVPRRHVGALNELSGTEANDLFAMVRQSNGALEIAYQPDGYNIGLNLGRAAGAGIPKHLHVHVLPRWNGDTNFMATLGETRVLPESLGVTWQKVTRAWPRAAS